MQKRRVFGLRNERARRLVGTEVLPLEYVQGQGLRIYKACAARAVGTVEFQSANLLQRLHQGGLNTGTTGRVGAGVDAYDSEALSRARSTCQTANGSEDAVRPLSRGSSDSLGRAGSKQPRSVRLPSARGALHALGLGKHDRLHTLLQIGRQSRGVERCATRRHGLIRLA